MTAYVRHAHQTALPNDPSKDISANAWNQDHDISGLLTAISDADAAVQAAAANDATTKANAAQAAAIAASQPLDSDLTAIAALSTTSYGRAFLALADAAAARAALALGTLATQSGTFSGTSSGTNTGDQDLSSYATTAAVAAGYQPLDSDLTAIAALSTTAYGRAFLALADAAAGRSALGLGTLATQSGTFSGTSSGTNTGDETATSVATILHAATSKATPVDADELSLIDSAASNVLKKLTWANLKATLKTYLDTLYGALATANTWTAQQTWVACSTTIASWVAQAGTLMTTAAAGAYEFDGKAQYFSVASGARGVVPAVQFACNGSVVSLSNSSTGAQNIFPSANDVFTVPGGVMFFVEAYFPVTTGTTTHTTTFSLGGTATFTSLAINQLQAAGSLGAGNAPQSVHISSAAGVAFNGTTNAAIKASWSGTIRINAGGTIIPQVAFSAGPGGTCQIEPGAFFRITPVGSNTVEACGNVA